MVTPLTVQMVFWLTLSLHLKALVVMPILTMMRSSSTDLLKVRADYTFETSPVCISAPKKTPAVFTFPLIPQVTICFWWLPMSSDTLLGSNIPGIRVHWCIPPTFTETLIPLSSLKMMSTESSLFMVNMLQIGNISDGLKRHWKWCF